MPQARPSSYIAVALSSVVLLLAMWWAWSTFTGVDPDADAKRREASFLPFDEYPDTPPQAKPAPEEKPETEPLPPARPPIKPNAPLEPEVVPTSSTEKTAPPAPLEQPAPEAAPPAAKALEGRSAPVVLKDGGIPAGARGSHEILVGEGRFWIGSTQRWVDGLAQASPAGLYHGLSLEAPRAVVAHEAFWIDRYEVTNHRYFEYLQRTATITYRTQGQPRRTLVQIAEFLMPARPPERPANLDIPDVTGRQLFRTNLTTLLAAFSHWVVQSRDGVIDLDGTYEHIRDRPVPSGVELTFYDRPPPDDWPDMHYPEKQGDHPVRGIALEEALAYAMYRGRYVPDEIEWEIAARGPSGLDYPWGSDGRGFEHRVNGGQSREHGDEAFTVPVHLFGDGVSWIGCYQMLGNVEEWTTSFLVPYPWAQAGPSTASVLVTRGGSANDTDRYAVRPAFRGWRDGDLDGAPRPFRRRAWTGFRTARLDGAGRSRIPVMHYRVRRGGQLDESLLTTQIYDGLGSEQVRTFKRYAGVDSVARPRPGVKALVLQPLRGVGVRAAGDARYVFNHKEGIASAEQLVALSHTVPALLLGLFHTDMTIRDLWQHREGGIFARSARDYRRLDRADAPPGTYYVAVVDGYPALVDTNLGRGWLISNRPATRATLNVIEQSYPSGVERRPSVHLHLRGHSGVDLRLVIPSHATEEPGHAVSLRVDLDLDPVELRYLSKPFETSSAR